MLQGTYRFFSVFMKDMLTEVSFSHLIGDNYKHVALNTHKILKNEVF